jgi:hypothetical protein
MKKSNGDKKLGSSKNIEKFTILPGNSKNIF